MGKVTEAIFMGGVLKPLEPLNLRDQQRVRLTIEEIAPPDREAAFARFLDGVRRPRFRSRAPLPMRDELHER